MKTFLGHVLLCIALLTSVTVTAQNGWNWPEDKATAQEKNALYTDALKNENYPEAQKAPGMVA